MPNSFHLGIGDPVRLRDATRSDVLQMRELERQSPEATHWTESQYQALFDAGNRKRIIRVAEEDAATGRIQGFLIASCSSQEWEVEIVIVDAALRRRGVGFLLMRDLVDAACADRAEKVLLEVRESNEPARRLYEKIGFTVEGRRKDYYRNPPEDALLYRLSLQFCDKIC
jgi:ribosomal-protein-alanine N-acetyltransferase